MSLSWALKELPTPQEGASTRLVWVFGEQFVVLLENLLNAPHKNNDKRT
jgi:hypothetical protein